MPFTVIAHSERQSAPVTLTKIAGVSDTHVRVSGDDVYIPDYNQIIGVYAIGHGLGRVQLDSPSLRDFIKPDFFPVVNTTTTATTTSVCLKPRNPISLKTNEALNVSITGGKTGQKSKFSAFTLLSDGPISPVGGEIHTIRFTATNVSTAWSWQDSTITFDQTLPVGKYQVVGMKIYGSNLIFGRLVPVGSFWRPGVPAQTSTSSDEIWDFRDGNFGVFCEFDQLTPPSLELFASAATNGIVGYLDLIKL